MATLESTAMLLILSLLSLKSAQAQCPAPFNLEAGRCVFVSTAQSFSWCSANQQCASIGGQLMNSHSSLQLLSNMPSVNCGCTLWLGVSDMPEERNLSRSGWQRIADQGSLPTDNSLWCSSDPNNLNNIQDCISHCSSSYGRLSDLQCSSLRGFACEFTGATPFESRASDRWKLTPFKRTDYNPSTEYCYADLQDVVNALQCKAAALSSGSSRHVLYNSKLRKCRLLLFTDAQVEEEIETSDAWVKFSVF